MKSKLILLSLLLFGKLLAQTELSPFVYANAGQYKEVSGYSFNYTIGESLIQTAVNNNTYTCGFNQPEVIGIRLATVEIDGKSIEVKAYPNPVSDKLTIDLSEALTRSLVFTLSDVTGKKIYTQKVEIGTMQLQIPTDGLPLGVYLVAMRQEEGSILHSFKIAKSH